MAMADDFSLEMLGLLAGTQKASPNWDYLRHYQELFSPWRDAEINLVEIGVQGGNSLEMWEAYFSRATIVGVDIVRRCEAYARGRVKIEIGSQENPGFLHHVCTKYPPTIVIDDGSHLAHHVVYTFERLFPALEAGGVYVIEDLAFHFGENAHKWNPLGAMSPADYFLAMANACMARQAADTQGWGTGRYIFDTVDSITFIRSAAIIRKKKPRDIDAAVAFARHRLAEHSHAPEARANFAAFLARNGHPLEEAEREARQAVAAGGQTPWVTLVLTDILMRMGRNEEAGQVARDACHAQPDKRDLWLRLAAIERKLGRHDEAAAAAKKAGG